ncbi:SPOR domain-containing protein [Rhodopseudomonas palustris]|uniref:SPOR domain-containing protein n=1 Tax=Rhodopseudomonas palustris TaxID=1076 RepID=A0A323UGD3_RHOPL|nr:SPOR domain-containing protein [Rhodopseudomonas palustris]PZA12022.1 SPOR domain-containing protein [Rhodopseudomonas palustris]
MTDRYQSRPFPTEDDDSLPTSRYPQKPENDPLAELARLIGQTDPFGQSAARTESAPPIAPQTRATDFRGGDFRASRAVPPADDELSAPPMPSWMQHRQPSRAPEPPRAPEPVLPPEPDFSRPPSFISAATPPRRADLTSYERAPAMQSPVEPRSLDMRSFDPEPIAPRAPEPRFDPIPVEQQRQLDLVQPDRVAYEPQYDPLPATSGQTSLEPGRYDETLYGELPADPAPIGGYQDPGYGYGDGYDEMADSQPLKPRRHTMTTVAAILALAVVGTGGALAYRTFAGATRSGEPPVIKADTTPTKIPGPSSDNAGKPIQDRLASGNGVEALVSREEQPAADPSRMPGSGPRVVLPQLNQNPNPPTVASVAPGTKPNLTPPPNNGTLAGDEPRRIKTFSIRPDQADQSAQTAGGTAAARQASRTAPPPARTPARNVEDANASAGAAPLSLSPGAGESPAPRAQRVASLPAAEPVTSGGYVVQVSSQRSEADAKSSYRMLQGKFSSVLGSQPHMIKKVDLGSKGVYYRAMVGPFASAEQAQQVCGNLKSAGGQCFVQRN